MTTIIQLDPFLPVNTPKGKGSAVFLLDYGEENHVLWGVVLDADGTVWWVSNPEISLRSNWSMGRRFKEESSS
jgi:hypothetical protein